MKSIFETGSKNEILQRIEKLSPQSKGLWGKMDVSQMLAHCANGMGLATGKIKPPRQLVGKLLGWLFKPSYYNERNFPKNIQTIKGGTVTDEKDFSFEKLRLIEAIEEMYSGGEKGCTDHPHPIMGSYTPAEWGKGMYKHLDHHLRQFGA
jgi:Protein of unknown function (DUF1569)